MLHRRALAEQIHKEIAVENERRMEMQHHLYKPERNRDFNSDLCLPAVFMPFRSGNIYNPKAYQYCHPIGTSGTRLTQAPSIFKLPSLSSESVSILNLFQLTRQHDTFSRTYPDMEKKE